MILHPLKHKLTVRVSARSYRTFHVNDIDFIELRGQRAIIHSNLEKIQFFPSRDDVKDFIQCKQMLKISSKILINKSIPMRIQNKSVVFNGKRFKTTFSKQHLSNLLEN